MHAVRLEGTGKATGSLLAPTRVESGAGPRRPQGRWHMLVALLMSAGLAEATEAREVKGHIQWPTEWVIFAPMDREDPLLEGAVLRAIPAKLEMAATRRLPARVLEPRRMTAKPGEPFDLSTLFPEQRIGNVAYVFVELSSPQAQTVTLGMGADWWLQAWVNGEPVFDTLEKGNVTSPISMTNHTVDVPLRQGVNVLAVCVISGKASALLGLGGPGEFAAEESRLAARAAKRSLNTPSPFPERLLFPVEEQAVAMAKRSISFPPPDADLARGGLVGLRPMPVRQLYLAAERGRRSLILDTKQRSFPDAVTILLSKSRYPWEDRHLDAIVWTTPPQGRALQGRLDVVLKDAAGAQLARHEIERLSSSGLFFSVGFPEALRGNAGALEVTWRQDDRVVGRAEVAFHIRPAADVAQEGRIPLRLVNEPKATITGAPMTVGVPFPRGALHDEANVRLVDEAGRELPLQTRQTARWSRYGPVKWLLCDFTADLSGGARTLFLEYGPNVRRAAHAPMSVSTPAAGFPTLDAGRIRVNADGVSFDPRGDGNHRPVLAPAALHGAFVRHEDGQLFTVPADVEHAVEELGSEKAVVRRTGWYVNAAGERFCQFVTRLQFHRDSPIVRVFHTWIFTGDGNKDRVRDMGWRFEAAQPVRPEGFLASFAGDDWITGRFLVQHDYRKYRLDGQATDRDGRTPGVLSGAIGDSRILFGAKDFWQRFPSELEFDGNAFIFHNWPAHNPPASYERPIARAKAFLHRYAHEGEVLDFRLPPEYADGPIWEEACSREGHWAKGRPETANAQGIARTEEMFLYFVDSATPAAAAARVMQGLNDESLRAVADPKWVADSGVFGDIHQHDAEKYPEDEHIYEQVVQAPSRWNERLGFYGKWLFGDVPAWEIDLHGKTVSLYRTIRKNHHGWPVVWIPFARSGDPRFLKFAEAATRQMTDSQFCHYATADVDASVGPTHFRRQGWWDRSLLPWAARSGPHLRSYTVDCDYIWDAYYLTGYARARDVVLLFGELTQRDHGTQSGPRATNSTMSSYLDMYQATFDPWFLAAAHEIAKLHMRLFDRPEVVDKLTPQTVSHFWRPADIKFYQFSGDDDYGRLALNHAISYSSPRAYSGGGLWPRLALPLIAQAAHAYTATGDAFHLARVAAYLDTAKMGVYDGELEYGRGSITQGGTSRGIFTGYYIRQFPLALKAFERAGSRPEPIPNPFWVNGTEVRGEAGFFEFALPEVMFRKGKGTPVSLMLDARTRTDEQQLSYEVTGPDGAAFRTGKWTIDSSCDVMVPGDAPAGVYRVSVGGKIPLPEDPAGRGRVRRRYGDALVPMAEPDVPEVIVFPRAQAGTRVASGNHELQYWFMVPAGVREFWIEFTGDASDLDRVSVWNPDGERVWDRSHFGKAPGRVQIAVMPEHAGKAWRASGGPFAIDPQIPPYFSVSRAKWFNPEAR